jgi:hypothetical protein
VANGNGEANRYRSVRRVAGGGWRVLTTLVVVIAVAATIAWGVLWRKMPITPPSNEVKPPAGFTSHGTSYCPGTQDGCSASLEWFDPTDSTIEPLSTGQLQEFLIHEGWFRDGVVWRTKSTLLSYVTAVIVDTKPDGESELSWYGVPDHRVLLVLRYADEGRSRWWLFIALVWATVLATFAVASATRRISSRRENHQQ